MPPCYQHAQIVLCVCLQFGNHRINIQRILCVYTQRICRAVAVCGQRFQQQVGGSADICVLVKEKVEYGLQMQTVSAAERVDCVSPVDWKPVLDARLDGKSHFRAVLWVYLGQWNQSIFGWVVLKCVSDGSFEGWLESDTARAASTNPGVSLQQTAAPRTERLGRSTLDSSQQLFSVVGRL